jgi:hypothetical protein
VSANLKSDEAGRLESAPQGIGRRADAGFLTNCGCAVQQAELAILVSQIEAYCQALLLLYRCAAVVHDRSTFLHTSRMRA